MKRKWFVWPALVALAVFMGVMGYQYIYHVEEIDLPVASQDERHAERDGRSSTKANEGRELHSISSKKEQYMAEEGAHASSNEKLAQESSNEAVTDREVIEQLLQGMGHSQKFDVLDDCAIASPEKLDYASSKIKSEYLELLTAVCTTGTAEIRQQLADELANGPDMMERLENLRRQGQELLAEMESMPHDESSSEGKIERIRLLFDKVYHEKCMPCETLLMRILRKDPQPLADWLGVPVESLSPYEKLRPDYFLSAFLFVRCSVGVEDCSPESEGAVFDCLNDTSVCGYDRITGLQMRIGRDNMEWVVTLANFFLAVSGYPAIDHPALPRDDPDAEP